MSKDGQSTEWHRNIAENFNRLSTVSRAHERYRRQTDGQSTAYNERERVFHWNHWHIFMLSKGLGLGERQFTFAKKGQDRLNSAILRGRKICE